MPINLSDIRQAVDTYLNNHVNVTVGAINDPGSNLNPNENFTFTVDATNTGGVRLINVRLRVWVQDQNVAMLRVAGNFVVPGAGFPIPFVQNVRDLNNNQVVNNALVRGFEVNFAGSHAWDAFNPGENLPALTISARAGSNPTGGTSQIRARIIADIDHSYLFPTGQNSNDGSRALQVVG